MDPNPPAVEPPQAPPPGDPRLSGPLDRQTAAAFLGIGDRLLEAGELDQAGAYYQRVVGFDDPAVTAAAVLGVGNVLYRLDRDAEALVTWRQVVAVGTTPSAYPAWRQIAAALVRDGDLPGAVRAYREADRLAPGADKAEIASRLGWLAKETGDSGAARRYFARSRGTAGALPIPLTYLIIGLTAIVSFTTMTPDGETLLASLWLDKSAVASGEWWRLLTVTLVHGGLVHLLFNMYALYLVGPLVERIYGWKLFGLMYLLCAAAGSVGSFLFGDPNIPSVGASGAIFGLFGVVLAATRIHDPILDQRGRALVGQVGGLIVLNLILGFGIGGVGGNIDNAAHVGGLLAGLWLGFVLVPGKVRTLRDLWQIPTGVVSVPGGGAGDARLVGLVRVLAVIALATVLLVGIAIGSDRSRFAGSREVSHAAAAGRVDPSPGIAALGGGRRA